ncbi:transmembrane protein 272-like [Haliotis rufescens]|uniref:transmembrane protein 272-like n=1 Tax=Haliotis rufescens TaxID=6454 RepID=UPI001EAFD2E1|nr:transmembrane protein 272-like [Haliotis rufescens]XP_048243913.1 transmembrane protein 272-like [Haliotis rufescens]XP_048243914.1 transmembrane protein 272-like [Haliotis rufescens]
MSSFLKKYNETKCGPVGTAVITIISLALPIAMVAMGAIHKDNCPAEKYIPTYMIVAGIFTIIVSVVRLVGKTCLADSDGNVWFPCQIVSGVISLFLFAWVIAGNVWIYGLYNKYNPTDKTAANYCDNTFYLFAFWSTTASYILIGVCILLCCCMCICCRN